MVKSKATEEKRKGTKAVYFSVFVGAGIAGVSDTAGRHPFDVVHIDHTPLELVIVDEESGIELGSPWLTLMVDAYTGAALSWYLSFNDPSVSSLMMLFRRLIMLHETFPFHVVSDNGADFYSNWYLTLLATEGADVVRRPPSKPRFGAIIERTFGIITSTLLYSLLGNTQRLKVPRTLLRRDHPGKFSPWTLPNLDKALENFFGLRANRILPHLGISGLDCITDYKANSGRALAQRVKFDQDFYIKTLLETRKGTCRVQRGYGVKFKHDYYSHPLLETKEGEDVRVLYDPDDVTGIYVLIDRQWIRAVSKHDGRLQGFSRRELEQYSKIYDRRYSLSEEANEEKKVDQAALIHSLKAQEECEQIRRRAIATRSATPPELLVNGSNEASKDADLRLAELFRPASVTQESARREELYTSLDLETTGEIPVTKKQNFKG